MLVKHFWKQIAIPLAIGVLLCLGATIYWIFIRDGGGPQVVPVPSSQIRFLSQDERLQPVHSVLPPNVYNVSAHVPPLPVDQVNNPVLFANHFAVVRFRNDMDRPLLVFDLGQTLASERGLQHAFMVEVTVWDAGGNILDGDKFELNRYRPYALIAPLSPDVILSRHPKTFTLQPAEWTDLQMPILGNMSHPSRGLKPGTYTVRATVSYAEAPSGETKRVMSDPVTVRVTEEDIKAADAYWAASK